jgi:hypothetical protein
MSDGNDTGEFTREMYDIVKPRLDSVWQEILRIADENRMPLVCLYGEFEPRAPFQLQMTVCNHLHLRERIAHRDRR